MKKLVFILQLMLLYSCTENGMTDIAQMDGNETIKFNVTVKDPITKSFITNEKEMAKLGFFGYRYDRNETWPAAYTNAKQIMYNTKMSYSGTDNELWEYPSNPYYWGAATNSERYSFFGIAPYNAQYTHDDGSTDPQVTVDANNGVTLRYYAYENPTTDLMVASSTNIYTPKDGVVTLDFAHALSALVFETDDYSNIESVMLDCIQLYTTGDVTVDSNPTWTLDNSWTDKVQYPLYENGESSECMIIPQEGWVTEDSSMLAIHITHKDGTTIDKFPIPATKFEAGKCYTFKISNSFFDVETDDDGKKKLYIDLDDFDSFLGGGTDANGYTGTDEIDAQIKYLEEQFKDIPEDDLTVVVTGDYKYYLLLSYILKSATFVHYDLSEVNIAPTDMFNYENTSNNTTIKSMIMPACMNDTNFYPSQFEGCTALESVTFPSTVTITEIDMKAFFNCTSLKSINIPASVITIGYSTFDGCNSLDGYDAGTGLGIKFDEPRTESLTISQMAFYYTLVTESDMPVEHTCSIDASYIFKLP